MLTLMLACGCRSARPSTAPLTATRDIDQIRLVAIPVALNLDNRPGPDGFGIKVYGLSRGQPKPQRIRQGAIEILMYDGLLPPGTNAVQPLCTWTYPAAEFPQYELKTTIGLAYQFAPRWGEKTPQHNRITVLARYKPDPEHTLQSAPSIITVPAH